MRYSTVANTSTMTRYGSDNQMAAQNKSNVLIAYKRGTGSTSADRQILVAHSSDAGHTFAEADITVPSNTDTDDPLVAATTNSVVAAYQYDSSGTYKICLARSTNGGATYSLSTTSNWGSLGTLISDGISKYYVGAGAYQAYLYASTDNGVSFKQMKVPYSQSSVSYVRWAATSSYLWVVFDKSAGDSIYVYRSSDNGSTYQFIGQYFVDLPSTSELSCCAISDQLYISWIHEEVGTYSLRTRTITGTTFGATNTVLSGTSSLYGEPVIKKATNRLFISLSDQVFQSTDGGGTWSRGSDITTELPSYPSLYSFIPMDDTTLYANLNASSIGSERYSEFGNWKWTDYPIPDLTNDTSITSSSSVDVDWWSHYVETPSYRFQMSTSSSLTPILLDTVIQNDYVYFQLRGRFPANGTRYYYHIRGEDVAYSTAWSPTKSFRYGSIITAAPATTAPANGATINYPTLVNCQWSTLSGVQSYSFHLSSNQSFTDTVYYYYDGLSNPNLSVYPIKNGAVTNGTFYWRVRGFEFATGSAGPWSQTASFNYTGVTAVDQQTNTIPKDFSLSQNYPNPFNPATTIKFGLPRESSVTLNVYDILGREVASLVNDKLQAGYYNIPWNASAFVSGIYIYRIVARPLDDSKSNFMEVKKLILLK